MKLFKKEREVVELAMEYLDTVDSCVGLAKAAVTAYLNRHSQTVAELHPQVVSLESRADEGRRNIEDKLFSGAYLPLMRGDIYSVLEALDGVPNAAEACCGFFFGEKPAVPEEFTDPFLRITADSFDVMVELSAATKKFFKPKGKIKEIRHHAQVVGEQETLVDRQEWDLTVAIFGSRELDLPHKMHLKRALDRIVHIPDQAEDAAESLVLAAMKSVL